MHSFLVLTFVLLLDAVMQDFYFGKIKRLAFVLLKRPLSATGWSSSFRNLTPLQLAWLTIFFEPDELQL